jgi:hypothetical protein
MQSHWTLILVESDKIAFHDSVPLTGFFGHVRKCTEQRCQERPRIKVYGMTQNKVIHSSTVRHSKEGTELTRN